MKELKLTVIALYDPETDTIVSYKTTLDGVADKVTTTRKVSKAVKALEGSVLIREDNKLILSEQLLTDIGAVADDRITVGYEEVAGKVFPVVGLDTMFGAAGNGNKLTKSNTVACRGKANDTLAAFGSTFGVEEYKQGVFKLIGDILGETDAPVKKAVKEVNLDIEVTGDTNYDIQDLTPQFSL